MTELQQNKKELPFFPFLRHYFGELSISAIFLLVGYGSKMFSNTFSIDTQSMIQMSSHQYEAWLGLQRYGLIAIKRILGTYWYNNSVASVLTPICFFISATIWAYLLYVSAKETQNFHPIYFLIPFLTAPIFAEQFGFLLQSAEIAISLGLSALSIIIILQALTKPHAKHIKVLLLSFSTFLLFSTLSMYLALITVFVTGVAIVSLQQVSSKNKTERFDFTFIATSATICVIGYVIFSAVNRCIQYMQHIDTNSYIDDQSLWKTGHFSLIIHQIISHSKEIYLGKGIFYPAYLTAFAVCFICILTIETFKHKMSVWSVPLGICICISPMLMTVILGNSPSPRTELSLPLALAFLIFFVMERFTSIHIPTINRQKITTWLAVAVVILIGLQQSFTTNRIFYTESIVYQNDVQLAYQIKEKIEKLNL